MLPGAADIKPGRQRGSAPAFASKAISCGSSCAENAIVAEDDSVCWVPSMSTTWAPASQAMMVPAAVSQGLLLSMMTASNLPAASHVRSIAAGPTIRIRWTLLASGLVMAFVH
jgi:hypothetical protein